MRFLLVDDQEDILLLMERILAPYGECVVAMDGRSALNAFHDGYAKENPFAAVFLDIQMPEMDGHEVANKLRELEADHDAENSFKLLMLSALSDSGSVSKSLFRGGKADAYITKPINKKNILEELRILQIIKD